MATRKLASTRQILSGDYDREIYEAMARAMFVSDWADRQEEKGKTYPGMDLMDVAPPTSRDALLAARALAAAVIRDNNVKSLTDLYARALNAGGKGDARKFGHYLAMQAMGHGVSWYDDGNPRFGMKLPHFEYYSGRGRVAQKLGHSTGKASGHEHRSVGRVSGPFFGPVSGKQNPKAHGGYSAVEHCSCGAKRTVNINGKHVERGSWGKGGSKAGHSTGKARAGLSSGGGRRIVVTYSKTTPESVEDGDFSDTGWIDEEGTRFNSPAEAIRFLKSEGATNPSSTHFHKGIWYSTDWSVNSYQTGEEEQRSYHLKGFNEREAKMIFDAIEKARRGGHASGKARKGLASGSKAKAKGGHMLRIYDKKDATRLVRETHHTSRARALKSRDDFERRHGRHPHAIDAADAKGLASGSKAKAKAKRTRVKASCACSATAVTRKKRSHS